MKITERSLDLSVDIYQRYRLIQEVVEIVRDNGAPLRILDVGGYPGHLLEFCPGDTVIILDQIDAVAPQYFRGDALNLPFRERSFDIVVSTDVLEHIPESHRMQFLSEVCRVADQFIVIAAPFFSERVRAAEHILFEFIKRRLGYEHPYLKEHIEFGLPNRDRVEAQLDAEFGKVLALPNGYLTSWLLMMLTLFYCDLDPNLEPLKKRINGYYNRYYYSKDNREPSYRYALISSRYGFTAEAQSKIGRLVYSDRELDLRDFSAVSVFIQLANLDLLKESYLAMGKLETRTKELEIHARALSEDRDSLRGEVSRLQTELNRIKSSSSYQILEGIRRLILRRRP